MYTQEQINNDRKHYLAEQKEICKQLLKDTVGTQICWEVSGVYELDKWDKNVIEVCHTEQQAKNVVKTMMEEGYELFYKPVVIDDNSGEKVNFQNLHYYKKDSYFVKQLEEYMYS